jgi:hypothetical protein
VKVRRLLLWAGRILTVFLLVLAVILLVRNGGEWLREIGSQDWQLDPLTASASVVLLLFSLWITPFGWAALCSDSGCNSGTGELRGVWFTSQLGRYIPGKVWLLAGRAGYLRTTGMSYTDSIAIPFLELLYTIAATGLIAASVALFTPGFLSQGALRTAAVIAGAGLVLIPLLGPLKRLLLKVRAGGDRSGAFHVPGPWISLRLLVFFTVVWLARGLSLYLWLSSLGVANRGIWACAAAAPLSWLAGYIVFLVPGGIGVREAAAAAMIAGQGETGPVLAAVAGQRLLLTAMELLLAGTYARKTPLFGKRSR